MEEIKIRIWMIQPPDFQINNYSNIEKIGISPVHNRIYEEIEIMINPTIVFKHYHKKIAALFKLPHAPKIILFCNGKPIHPDQSFRSIENDYHEYIELFVFDIFNFNMAMDISKGYSRFIELAQDYDESIDEEQKKKKVILEMVNNHPIPDLVTFFYLPYEYSDEEIKPYII